MLMVMDPSLYPLFGGDGAWSFFLASDKDYQGANKVKKVHYMS